MQDPTKEEMIFHLIPLVDNYIRHEPHFEIEEAIYWFCSDYHGGQWSELYSALSTSPFNPGCLSTGAADGNDLYLALVAEYG